MTPSKEYFATKLAAGTADASKMAAWWPLHCHATTEHLALSFMKSGDKQMDDSREILSKLSMEWERRVPPALRRRAGASVGLMREHSLREIELIEASAAGDTSKIERLGDLLLENAKAHGPRYAYATKGFPEHRFSELFRGHIEIFVDSIQCRMEKDARGAVVCVRRSSDNAVALSMIAAEWF